jgi:hypothetical protein
MADGNDPMNDSPIDRALRETLDVSPSSDFVARVRTRIASEPTPRSAWARWSVWMPATVGAAAVIALAVWMAKPGEVRLKPDTTTASAPATSVTPDPTVRLKADTSPDTVRLPPSPQGGFGETRKPGTTYEHQTNDGGTYVVSAFRRTLAVREEPEILISPSESAALRRLIVRASEAQVVVNGSSPSATDSGPSPSDAVQPLPEIQPLKIDPVMPVNGEEGVRQ